MNTPDICCVAPVLKTLPLPVDEPNAKKAKGCEDFTVDLVLESLLPRSF